MEEIVKNFLFVKYMVLACDRSNVYSGRDDFYGGCMSVFDGGIIKRKLVVRKPNESYEDFIGRVDTVTEVMIYEEEQSGLDYYQVYGQESPIYQPNKESKRYLNGMVVEILERARQLKINDTKFYIYHDRITDAKGCEVDVEEVMAHINDLKKHLPS